MHYTWSSTIDPEKALVRSRKGRTAPLITSSSKASTFLGVMFDSSVAGGGGGGGGGGGCGEGTGISKLDTWPGEGVAPVDASAISSSRDVAASSLVLRKYIRFDKIK